MGFLSLALTRCFAREEISGPDVAVFNLETERESVKLDGERVVTSFCIGR